MSRQKAWIWMTLALVCAVGAAAVAFFSLQQRAIAVEQNVPVALPTPTPIPTVKLPVAARDLAAGAVLATTDIMIADFPVQLAPASAITLTELLAQQVLAEPIAKGDFFRQRALLGGAGAPISGQIEPGKTIIAFPVADALGQTGLIQDGDHVDLLLTISTKGPDGQDLGKTTGYTVQNAQVFRVLRPPKTEQNPNPQPNLFLLLLAPKDAVLVKFVKDSGGTIDLGLRSPQDKEPFDAPAATEQDWERTFNLRGR